MPKLLIVDDDIHLRKLVRTYAKMAGHEYEEAENGNQAIEKIYDSEFDIIILDVLMPGIDGFKTLEKIRMTSHVPVIMLTSRSEEYDKLSGFNLGADDYIVKPFSPRELMARINAVLKRSSKLPGDELVFGDLSIDPATRIVTAGKEAISLPPKEFDLMLFLAQNERLVMSREQLLDKVWGQDYYGDSRTIDTHVKSLREHLGEYRKTIKTVWGIGYKFEY